MKEDDAFFIAIMVAMMVGFVYVNLDGELKRVVGLIKRHAAGAAKVLAVYSLTFFIIYYLLRGL